MTQRSALVKSLNGRAVYEGPVLCRKVVKTEPVAEGSKEYYDAPINEEILDWLDQNSLFKTNVRINALSQPAHVFFGSNGTLCALYPEREDFGHSGSFRTGDYKYQWKINIRHQPAKRGLSAEIEEALINFGFQKKE